MSGRVRRTAVGDRAAEARGAPVMLGLLPSSDEDPIGLDEACDRLRRRDGTRPSSAMDEVDLLIERGLAETVAPPT